MMDEGWPLEKQPQKQDAHRAFVSQALVFAPSSRLRLKSIQYGGWRGDSYTEGAAQTHPALV